MMEWKGKLTTLIVVTVFLVMVLIKQTSGQKYSHLHLRVDKSASYPTDSNTTLEEIANQLTNLPILDWTRNKEKIPQMFYKNSSCAPYPSIFNLDYDSTYWQALRTSNASFFFIGAYYDSRQNVRRVRIISMIDRKNMNMSVHCQLWFDNRDEPVLVETHQYHFIWRSFWGGNSDGTFQPYLVTCELPAQPEGVPTSVSLVKNACDAATNHLRVTHVVPPEKKSFAVCVKGLNFLYPDLSVRLVEWMELLFLLGADKVFFYQFQVHPNISRVLDHYVKLGKAVVTPLTLPGGKPNFPLLQKRYLIERVMQRRLNEVIPYNDCLYRNLYSYDYITLLDIDEVIVPTGDMNWQDLMRKVLSDISTSNKKYASFNARHVYFFDDMEHKAEILEDVPRYMHLLQHVMRSKNYTPPMYYIKSFFPTDNAISIHNHLPIDYFNSVSGSYSIDPKDAKLHHYRNDCVLELRSKCGQYRNNVMVDTEALKYKHALISEVTRSLINLGFI